MRKTTYLNLFLEYLSLVHQHQHQRLQEKYMKRKTFCNQQDRRGAPTTTTLLPHSQKITENVLEHAIV